MKFLKILIIVIFFIIFVNGCSKNTTCGNGVVEEGENRFTCCEDTGCLGEQTCQNHKCIEPICNSCQYLNNHICIDYECCKNEDCDNNQYCLDHKCINFECIKDSQCENDEICQANKCIKLVCYSCQYASDHKCIDYECCEDEDCVGGQLCINHDCEELTCGECQYLENNQCVEYTCCEDGDCDKNEVCQNHECYQVTDSICKNNDYYCPWECNDWELDSDCGTPEIYNFIESRSPNDYLNSDMIHWDDTEWRSYEPLIQKVNELTNGLTDDFEKAKAIANWVKHSRPYSQPSPANKGESVIEIFNANTGICMDAAILTAAMFRIAGIPSRAVLPWWHEYAEGYIDGRWIGFETTFSSQEPQITDPVTSILVNNQFYKKEPKFVSIFSDGTKRDITEITYYKSNIIPRDIYKNAKADISITWSLNNHEEVKEKYCTLSSYKTSLSQRFDNSPILKTINNDDNSYSLNCIVIPDLYTQYNELIKITFTGTHIETESISSDGYVDIDVETVDIEKSLANWGTIYIPITSATIFKNKDNTYSLAYDKEKYSDFRNIGWEIKSDNLNCNYYTCSYIDSNQYSQNIARPGIFGYGTLSESGTRDMPPNHYNGFAKIKLPEGKYKLIYSMPFCGEIGYGFFEVVPNQKAIIFPNDLQKANSATQNQFKILQESLEKSIKGLNP